MPNHIICRRTGETVATRYDIKVSSDGKKWVFYHRFEQVEKRLSKPLFDANYRIEKVEYK